MKQYFDLSLLPKALSQFTILSDTHYMVSDASISVEFPSRSKQTNRSALALKAAASLPNDFTVHLGDLVQEYPETEFFVEAINKSLQQIKASGLNPYYVPGNHDVGDKPDPAMPTHQTNKNNIDHFQEHIGRHYYAFDCGPLRGISLNSQIFNTPYANLQRLFLEQELAACTKNRQRVAIFLHLPPYLYEPDESSWGHYDNIDEPDRSWLLDLLTKHNIEIVFCGHAHFAFLNQMKNTRIVVCPSPSFTRPGFGHLFTGAPAPEQGRDDRAKLGFYFVRVFHDRIDLHFIRTNGLEKQEENLSPVITRLPSSLKGAPLGITLTHPVCNVSEVPITFPSVTRQKVRNDYPLLSILELGVTKLRVPWTDIQDPLQCERLQVLRKHGVKIQAFTPSYGSQHLHSLLDQFPGKVDLWEIQMTGDSILQDTTLDILVECHRRTPLALSTVIPFQKIKGKQHPRPRIGFLYEELEDLNKTLSASGLTIDRLSCRTNVAEDLNLLKKSFNVRKYDAIGNIDWLISLPHCDDEKNAHIAATALFFHFQTSESSIYFDPPIDLDRTMDVAHGILDVRCNPRPVFHVLRALNTILYVYRGKGYVIIKDDTRFQLRSNLAEIELLLPNKVIQKSTNLLLFDLINCSRLEQPEGDSLPTICLAVYPR